MNQMSKSNEIQFQMIEKLFDERLDHLNGKIDGLVLAINGNGKKGILERLVDLENMRIYIYAAMSVVVLFIGALGIYARGFIEDIYKHLYRN